MPLTTTEQRAWIYAKCRALDNEGYTQQEIGQQLQISQQNVSQILAKLRQADIESLREHHLQLATTYRQTFDNLLRIRKELWETVKGSTDRRTKASLFHELSEVNLKILELASTADIVNLTLTQAMKIQEDAKKDMQKVKDSKSSSIEDNKDNKVTEAEPRLEERGDPDSDSADSVVVVEEEQEISNDNNDTEQKVEEGQEQEIVA
jgi:predicted transcriptional regulator